MRHGAHCHLLPQARNRVELAAEEVRVKSKLEAEWFGALRAEYSVSMEDVPTALAAWRECCTAGNHQSRIVSVSFIVSGA